MLAIDLILIKYNQFGLILSKKKSPDITIRAL